MKLYPTYIKRTTDFVVALVLIAVLSPVFILSVAAVILSGKGPVFFTQDRFGYKGRSFRILKFRTMTHKKREFHHEVFKGNTEVTAVGAVLRRLKIDELPQLLNILSGDMSIVGPRPGLADQLKDLDENGKVRLQVRPGLTGLAQVNGNIHLSWQERWKYDRIYVENISLILDFQILLKTFAVVLRGEEKFIKKVNV